MNLSEMKQAAAQSGALRAAAESAEAQKLMQTLDGKSIEAAIQQGDAAALKDAFAKLLSTPEGKDLAARVQEAVKQK